MNWRSLSVLITSAACTIRALLSVQQKLRRLKQCKKIAADELGAHDHCRNTLQQIPRHPIFASLQFIVPVLGTYFISTRHQASQSPIRRKQLQYQFVHCTGLPEYNRIDCNPYQEILMTVIENINQRQKSK